MARSKASNDASCSPAREEQRGVRQDEARPVRPPLVRDPRRSQPARSSACGVVEHPLGDGLEGVDGSSRVARGEEVGDGVGRALAASSHAAAARPCARATSSLPASARRWRRNAWKRWW